jgi:hypothetical protein
MEKLRQGPMLHLGVKGLDDDDDDYYNLKLRKCLKYVSITDIVSVFVTFIQRELSHCLSSRGGSVNAAM